MHNNKKKKSQNFLTKKFYIDNQGDVFCCVLIAITLLKMFSITRPYFEPFLSLNYPQNETDRKSFILSERASLFDTVYGIGPKDLLSFFTAMMFWLTILSAFEEYVTDKYIPRLRLSLTRAYECRVAIFGFFYLLCMLAHQTYAWVTQKKYQAIWLIFQQSNQLRKKKLFTPASGSCVLYCPLYYFGYSIFGCYRFFELALTFLVLRCISSAFEVLTTFSLCLSFMANFKSKISKISIFGHILCLGCSVALTWFYIQLNLKDLYPKPAIIPLIVSVIQAAICVHYSALIIIIVYSASKYSQTSKPMVLESAKNFTPVKSQAKAKKQKTKRRIITPFIHRDNI
ncbi:Translocating chain-associated membrane protein 1-like 1 [Thelohanellus kitauei]|uniref:Translocating chain-associated membrane protein 1-like 1 n=1 Tax=Thelohanellus kitauei TaxID=669202 RepID=A0A0C2JYT6_THEKT|nr:Translocating chain-associated membrane protein 1-like 1 [Thelohanellus kitauei]